jgi:hypothetical protein
MLEFTPLLPTHLPENINFEEAKVNEDGSIWLLYNVTSRQGTLSKLYIYEKNIENSYIPRMTIGASANIILTRVNTADGIVFGDYVRGDWGRAVNITPPSENSLSGNLSIVWQWEKASLSQHLRWKQGNLFIALYYQVTTAYTHVISGQEQGIKTYSISTLLDQEDLLQIASGMKENSIVNQME